MAKILLVDDDETMLQMLEDAFRSDGHEVTRAMDGEKAIEMIRENTYDLAIIDYKMPDMSGPQILSQLQLENAFIPPTMVLSSKVSHELINECLEAGAKDFVIKPFNLPVLVQRAQKILQSNYHGMSSQ